MPTRFLINQCQIITFLILKYDIIENSRIELRGIVLPVQVGGLLGGGGGGGRGGAKGMLPPLSNYWGAWFPPPPLPTPMIIVRPYSISICMHQQLSTDTGVRNTDTAVGLSFNTDAIVRLQACPQTPEILPSSFRWIQEFLEAR